MKLSKKLYLGLALFGFSQILVAAVQNEQAYLLAEREQVVQQYIQYLGKADYQDIASLFSEDGIVVSTSRGRVDARQFFNNFFPQIESSETKYHQGFISLDDANRYAGRFHLRYQLKDGERGEGEYVDEFIFVEHSAVLKAVYMFENLKFKDA